MILIVEGSNKVGKSTFIEELKNELNKRGIFYDICDKRVAINNKVKIEKEKMTEITENDFMKAIKKELLNIGKKYVYIFDRSYLTEYIYGKKYRDYENYRVLNMDKLISKLPFVKQLLLLSNYDHIVDKFKAFEYLEIEYKMLVQATKLNSKFDLRHIESLEDIKKIAFDYAEKIANSFE